MAHREGHAHPRDLSVIREEHGAHARRVLLGVAIDDARFDVDPEVEGTAAARRDPGDAEATIPLALLAATLDRGRPALGEPVRERDAVRLVGGALACVRALFQSNLPGVVLRPELRPVVAFASLRGPERVAVGVSAPPHLARAKQAIYMKDLEAQGTRHQVLGRPRNITSEPPRSLRPRVPW
jgi:hypothetical protein